MELSIRLFFAFAVFSLVSSCFITNCPPGGKRSISDSNKKPMRECANCGQEGQGGRCFGPQTCCSPLFGCLIGTPETYTCLLENRVSTLCHNPGDPCSGNSESGSLQGVCAAEGICCSNDSCERDDNCHFEAVITKDIPDGLNKAGQLGDSFAASRESKVEPPLDIMNRYKYSMQRILDKRKAAQMGFKPRMDF